MKPGFSLWLDVLRACAALVVLFGHMAHIRFTRGDYYFLREINIASDAVIVFFVLSGVVIAYAAGRDGSLARFAFNRWTRLLTVVLPALVLTVLFDAVGTKITMESYPVGYYAEQSLWDMFWRGLTFTNEWQGVWSDRLRLGSNGPLWSLSYEAAFYAIFAVTLFLKGALRAVLLALLVLLVGLPILALLPAWGIGVLLWYRLRAAGAMPRQRAWMLALGGPVALVVLKICHMPDLLAQITADVVAPLSHHALLVYSDEVLWNTVIALGVALHLRGVHGICRADPAPEGALGRAVRWCAGASFSLYVVHYPVLHLLDASLPETLPLYDLWLLSLTLGAALIFAAMFERPLPYYRRITRHGAVLARQRIDGWISGPAQG